MRVTGRRDQKFAPSTLRRRTGRISECGSGRLTETRAPLAKWRAQALHHPLRLVGENDRQVALPDHRRGAIDRFQLVEHCLDAILGEPALEQSLTDECRGL